MNNPLVSICIPAYKCEKTIEKAVNSALNQTYKNIEIIIIDDNSPDNTFKILESIKDNRIHLNAYHTQMENIFIFSTATIYYYLIL